MQKGPTTWNTIDLSNKRFGRLVALKLVGMKKYCAMWLCQCDCGNEKIVNGYNLRSGNTMSCGCLHKEKSGDVNRKHGMTETPEYTTWCSMKARCYNPNNKEYNYWGGRGIKVCDEWLNDFESFYNHIGPKPGPGFSIDRIDNEGNYEPGNVRWATALEQSNNKRTYKKGRKNNEESV